MSKSYRKTNEEKKEISQKKKDMHVVFDSAWNVSSLSLKDKRELRSMLYRLWAAVLLDEEERFDIRGIINAAEGDHHISKLDPTYYTKMKRFTKCVLIKQNEGDVIKLFNSLKKWFADLDERLLESSADTQKKIITDYFAEDEEQMVSKIRRYVGFRKAKTDEIVEGITMWEDEEDMEMPEINEEEAELKQLPELSVKHHKKKKTPSLEDQFVNDFMDYIENDNEQAPNLFEKSIKMIDLEKKGKRQVKEQVKENDIEQRVRKNIINSIAAEGISHLTSKAALKFAEKMDECGSSYAQKWLGYYYAKNVINEQKWKLNAKDKEKFQQAIEYWEKAALQGEVCSSSMLGSLYIYGFEVEQNYNKALIYAKMAAESGHDEAQLHLGDWYKEGRGGIARDSKEAIKWYKLAAQQGNTEAAINLIEMKYWTIEPGVEHNDDYIFRLVEKADITPLIQIQLAECYMLGKGVESDLKKAFKYFQILSKEKMPEEQVVAMTLAIIYLPTAIKIEKQIKELKEKIYEDDIDELSLEEVKKTCAEFSGHLTNGAVTFKSETIKSFKKIKEFINFSEIKDLADKTKKPEDQYQAGMCYFEGKGIKQDFEKAFEYFTKSAGQNHPEAKKQIKLCLAMCYISSIASDVLKIIFEDKEGKAESAIKEPKPSSTSSNPTASPISPKPSKIKE